MSRKALPIVVVGELPFLTPTDHSYMHQCGRLVSLQRKIDVELQLGYQSW